MLAEEEVSWDDIRIRISAVVHIHIRNIAANDKNNTNNGPRSMYADSNWAPQLTMPRLVAICGSDSTQ